jgi:hypothetical protein
MDQVAGFQGTQQHHQKTRPGTSTLNLLLTWLTSTSLRHVLAHDRILERLNAQLNRIQERLNSEFHQFFPGNTDPSSDV